MVRLPNDDILRASLIMRGDIKPHTLISNDVVGSMRLGRIIYSLIFNDLSALRCGGKLNGNWLLLAILRKWTLHISITGEM